MDAEFTARADGKYFSGQSFGRDDIGQMLEAPRRGSHRRAQSETVFRLLDDVLFDVETDFGLPGIDMPALSEDNNSGEIFPMMIESGKSEESNGGKETGRGCGSSHFRSLSVDAAFFESLGFQSSGESGNPSVGEAGKRGHRHSSSVDDSSSLDVDSAETKKVMGADKLAELALIDPKRAKRILANRQSAARSKERKVRYTSELERKVQTLQTEATTLSAQLTMLQIQGLELQNKVRVPNKLRDTSGLTAENKGLKFRLQAMEQQAHLCDALNEALREEVQRLKIATGQVQSMNENAFNGGLQQQSASLFSHSQQFHQLGGPQMQQQLHMSQISPNSQPVYGQSQGMSMNFMKGSSNNHL